MFRGVLARARSLKIEQPTSVVVGAIFICAVYLWRLGNQPHAFSPAEIATKQGSFSLHTLYSRPAYAPHNVLIYLLTKLHHAGLWSTRLVSVVMSLVFIYCFYRIACAWFGKLIGGLATLMLASTPLVLLSGRSGAAYCLYLFPLLLAAVYYGLLRATERSKALFVLFWALAALALYIPGLPWVVAAGLILTRRPLKKLFAEHSRWIGLVAILVFLGLLVPLVLRCAHTPDYLRTIWLVPRTNIGIAHFAKNIGWAAAGLIWRSQTHIDMQVGRLGVLNIAEIVLALFGAFALWQRARSKIYTFVSLIVFSVIAAGLNGNSHILLLSVAPVVAMAAAGLRFLLLEWRGVFPRNPLPRTFALVLVCAAVFFSVAYGLRYGLVAWPHTLSTRSLYVLK